MHTFAKLLCSFLVTLGCILYSTTSIKAQTSSDLYQRSQRVKVMHGANELVSAWDGGSNTPQFSMADVNKDGKKDLVVYEASRSSVKTYIAQGSGATLRYKHDANFEQNFPLDLRGFVALQDYNCDGISDLFHRGNTGIAVYKGYYDATNKLAFSFYKNLYHNNVNAYVDNGDIPGVIDADGDGDLDFFAYNILGGYINYYKNMRVEQSLPCDSIVIRLQDACWGKTAQFYYQTHQLGISCITPPLAAPEEVDRYKAVQEIAAAAKTTHTGNTLCFVDFNNDKIVDYFDGSISWQHIQYFTNGRLSNSAVDTIVAQDTTWTANGHTLKIDTWPAGFWLDVNEDGVRDMIFSPHLDNGSEDIKGVNLYQNTGTVTAPSWSYRGDSFFVDQHMDVGSNSHPFLYDYNKDGKLDLFIACESFYKGNGLFGSALSYYENTSTVGNPSYMLKDKDFLNLSTSNLGGFSIAIGDLNNDGKDDLLLGKNDGKLVFYRNTAATNNVMPQWTLQYNQLPDQSNQPIDVTLKARPFIADIDNDGKKDLIIGKWNGYVSYYKNQGNSNALLSFVTDSLGKMHNTRNGNSIGNAVPFYGVIDNSVKKYFLLGGLTGRIGLFENPIGNTDPNATFTHLDTNFSHLNVETNSSVTVGDLDNDGNRELISGNSLGGLELYYQSKSTNLPYVQGSDKKLELYPNPSTGVVRIMMPGKKESGTLKVLNMAGQVIYQRSVSAAEKFVDIDMGKSAAGIYQVQVQTEDYNSVARLCILK